MQELMEREDEPLAPAGERDAMATATTRAAQEVQAAMVIAKKFPRNCEKARAAILKACERPGLAEDGVYEYPKGGQLQSDASIRLAEAMATNWGNMDFGIIELAQDDDSSVVQSYCHDLETNVRSVRIFTVPHSRYTRNGSYKLTDPREIYEMVANYGSRRLRACITATIPGDVKDDAVAACNKTILSQSDKPLAEQIAGATERFAQLGVTQSMLLDKLGVKRVDGITHRMIARLRGIYNAIADGIGSIKEFFPNAAPESEASAERLKQAVAAKLAKQGTKITQEPETPKEPEPPPKQEEAPPAEVINPTTGEVTPAEPLPQSKRVSEREQVVTEYLEICEAKGLKMRSISGKSIEAIRGFIAEAKEMQAK